MTIIKLTTHSLQPQRGLQLIKALNVFLLRGLPMHSETHSCFLLHLFLSISLPAKIKDYD